MEQFARDFGYLDKFLANMAKHADTLPPDRGGRLKQLMAEETARWEEVKRLLAGGAPATAAVSASAEPAASDAAPTKAAPVAPIGLTIGSLLGVPKK